MTRSLAAAPWLLVLGLAACSASTTEPIPAGTPCGSGGTVSLAVAQTTVIDCSNGTSVMMAGNGASYLVVAEFAGNQGPNSVVNYKLTASGGAMAAAAASVLAPPAASGGVAAPTSSGAGLQGRFDAVLLRQAATARGPFLRQLPAPVGSLAPPPLGSVRGFHVISALTGTSFTNVGAALQFIGDNLLVYVDTLAPAGGFTPTQLQAFSRYFDQTLYGLVTGAFGSPSDLDQNGRVIMLMSTVVNSISPAANCATQGFIAGFFAPGDLSGGTNSNLGEVFYTIVPDPQATVSCAHSVQNVGDNVPATFVHEMQHLINYSQHVVVRGVAPMSSWMDEGLSIIAEELGSLFYEQRCPPPACRTNPSQLFPDSAQGFVRGFLFDSYQYGLKPDTASLTLNTDNTLGFAWRGGDWLLMRYLGDQLGSGVFRQLEQGPSDGVTDIATAAGQSFQQVMANFGIALYSDSLPGLPRTTAPPADRFVSRNLRELWARLFATSNGAADVPRAFPILPTAITANTPTGGLDPGTLSFYRLNTGTAATVTLNFSQTGGGALAAALHPQLAIFRLPAGQ